VDPAELHKIKCLSGLGVGVGWSGRYVGGNQLINLSKTDIELVV